MAELEREGNEDRWVMDKRSEEEARRRGGLAQVALAEG